MLMSFSGKPVVIGDAEDDPDLGKDPKRNNYFDYTPDPIKCPFMAHSRKVGPRSDLKNIGRPDGAREKHSIMRGGENESSS
jgi:hypothetical protein